MWILPILIITGIAGMVVLFLRSKSGMKEVEMEKPVPFNDTQKKSLAIVLIALIILLVPNIINEFAPNPVTRFIAGNIGIQLVCLVGAILFTVLKLANPAEVFRSRIPWNSIITISGMAILVALAGQLGLVEELGAWVGESVPGMWMPLMLVFIAALLSYVVAYSSVIYPLLAPMVGALSAVPGISPIILALYIMVGANCSSFSPVSTGGSMSLLGASDEQRDRITNKQFRWAFYFLACFCVIFAVLGVF